MLAIKTADLTQDFKRYADRVIKGEKVLISRPKNENLVVITEQEYNEFEKLRQKEALAALQKAFEAVQEQSVINGTDKIAMDEINDIIAEVRREKRDV
ncbi:MAG: type II toxin-antitoxin system Phd/YefM family antitoxin [Oscillospiraceae bacterium]|nr:type II toxin-antitoxin system Phd/YefM family antitoxin [Oscillospiraceae bacterium]